MPFFSLFCFVLLISCSVGPHYQPPDTEMPCEWHSSLSEGMQSAGTIDNLFWWESLNDPILNSLIHRAAQQNLDLFIASIRILESRAIHQGKKGDLYPHIDASASTGHLYFSKDALLNGILAGACENGHHKRNINFFEIGFDADWEIDLFGATQHEIKAMLAESEAAEEALNQVWITLSAEVARNYIELRSLQQQLLIAEQQICSQKDTIHLIAELIEIGSTTSIDFHQAEEQLGLLIAKKPLFQLAIDKAIHRLSILLGYAPAELFAELSPICSVPTLPCETPIALPSELLRRRPDIKQAERTLAASTERIGAAVASLFPRFSLKGFIGDISTQLPSLFSSSSGTWFGTPQLLFPIFNSRLLMQDVKYNELKTQEALYEYQKTVLNALEETENAIASYHYELERHQYLLQAKKASQDAYESIFQLYQIGVKDYLEVLVAQRSLFATEDALLQSQFSLLIHYIALYKALGGSFICEPEPEIVSEPETE